MRTTVTDVFKVLAYAALAFLILFGLPFFLVVSTAPQFTCHNGFVHERAGKDYWVKLEKPCVKDLNNEKAN